MAHTFSMTANLVDVPNRRIFPATVAVENGRITSVTEESQTQPTYLLPGFIDAHVHIESSMLVPREFARAAVVHGTVASVSDPHEIGNVLGTDGVRYMLEDAEGVPFKVYFGAPSCVPATPFETAGAEITGADVAALLDDPRIFYLSEMMNFPGVLHGDPVVRAKLQAARDRDKPVDGHAPGVRGESARRYFTAGITTDHESFTEEEARDKLQHGAKIAIREGSAARNFEALVPLIGDVPDRCMLCSDDKHPDDLLEGHINRLVQRAVAEGYELMNVLQAACVTPVEHYGLDVGLLRPGDDADFIEVADLEDFRVLRTFIRGEVVAENGETSIPRREPGLVNRFDCSAKRAGEFRIAAESNRMNVIEAADGQLITRRRQYAAKVVDGSAVADPDRDVLKMAVVNRYQDAPPAVAFVTGFGLKGGAIASSVAHDSHNVIAVGCTDKELTRAVNLVIEAGGGLSVVGDGAEEVLELPIAGLMAPGTCRDVGQRYAALDRLAKQLGATLQAPFMTLSFMALLVIPEIKLSDRGLFDGTKFEFLPPFA